MLEALWNFAELDEVINYPLFRINVRIKRAEAVGSSVQNTRHVQRNPCSGVFPRV